MYADACADVVSPSAEVADGHGENGHKVSHFVQASVLLQGIHARVRILDTTFD